MGKIKGKISMGGDKGRITYKKGKEDVVIDYEQPFSKVLGLDINSQVIFDIITVQDKNMAVSVNNVNLGIVKEIGVNSGTLQDISSNTIYPFTQPYLKESDIYVDSQVSYTLVNTGDSLQAVCLNLA